MTRYALISVSDKTGIELLATRLEELGYTILSTSNTAKHLLHYCRKVVQVSDLTGFPEILDGRVKTLHPRIHGGILADRTDQTHLDTLSEHGIARIDVVTVNLYPFVKVRQDSNSTHTQIIENIDIGGPALIRAAAKNYHQVAVLTDPEDYSPTLEHLKQEGGIPEQWGNHLANKAFAMVSRYDAEIAGYFSQLEPQSASREAVPTELQLKVPLHFALRYGENPHQQAGFYAGKPQAWEVLHGKELSFNNLMDMDSALRTLHLFSEPTVVIIKHCNPCGLGSGNELSQAYQKAFATDTASPFGGIVAVNRSLDLVTAELINQVFTEIIIAPDFEPEVLEFLRRKKNRRLIRYNLASVKKPANPREIKTLTWGYLAQDWDLGEEGTENWKVVTEKQPSPQEKTALLFAWKAVSVLKSNAIVLAGEDRIFGMGSGQTSRIDSTCLAIWKAHKYGHDLQGAVCASDGFFPYRDSIDEVARQGITALIQPGGSKGDAESIAACNELGLSMVFTGYRHFRH